MGKSRSVLFAAVLALLGMSLVAAGILSITGAQILPLEQILLGGNAPMAALTLGVGFLIAAAERPLQTTFTRLAIIYAVASIIFQMTSGNAGGTHVQAIVVPVVGALLLIVLHPDPRAIVPTMGSPMTSGATSS